MSGLIFSLIFVQVSIFVVAFCLVLSSLFMGLRMRETVKVRPISLRQYRARRLNINRYTI